MSDNPIVNHDHPLVKVGDYALVRGGLYGGIVAKVREVFPDRVILGETDYRTFHHEDIETNPQVIIEHLAKQKQTWRDAAERMAMLRRDDKELYEIVMGVMRAEFQASE